MYNRDSAIMRKLLGRPLPDSTSPSDPSSLSATTTHSASTIPATYRPSKAQDAVYAAGVPISCLDVSPDRRSVALGGPHILKTIVVDDPSGTDFRFSEGVDVRARIAAGGVAGPKANSVADQLNIRDVKWHGNNMVFTACANGRIFAYDVARLGAGASEGHDIVHVQDDSRQVNTLDVNPHLKSWLLSGGQDGMVRCFDTANAIHTRQGFVTFRQRFAALRCIDSIRQVKWSPQVGHEMAACTESGVVLKWDVRQPSKPLLRINAHEKACTGIAWHPDGQHLISAGSDCKLHIWETGREADRRQKPKWTISTPAPVAAVAWRPGVWSATAQGRRVAQVAVSYDDNSVRRYGTSAVHLYDIARPTMPYKEVERFQSSPSALSWQDQDMLWTVGQDGMFNQCDMAYAPRAMDRQSTSAMDFSPRGDVLMFLDERTQPPRPRSSVLMQSDGPRSYASSPQNQGLSVSRSDSEEDVVGTFLAPRRRMHKRRPSGRTAMSTTPPTFQSIEDGKQVLGLEDALKATGPFKLQQAMAFGHIPAAKTVPVYQYLSSVYLETLTRELPYVEGGKPLLDRVALIMEQYARAAEKARLFRLAQTWRILSFAMALLLERRAQYHLEKRVSRHQQLKNGRSGSRTRGENTPRRSSMQERFLGRSLLSDIDSTSNVPTPIARPADRGVDHVDHAYHNGRKMLTPIEEPESFSIGPSIHDHMPEPRKRLESTPISFTSEDSEGTQKSSTEGYDFYDMEALAHAIDVPMADGRQPRRRVSRHDSNESYGQMFSISEGTKNQNSASPAKGSPRRPNLRSEDSKASEDSEYHSRIRGEELREERQPEPRRHVPAVESPEDVFMISQTTQPSEESYPSQQSSYQSAGTDDHEDNTPEPKFPPEPPTPQQPHAEPMSSPTKPHPYVDPNPLTIETDYLPWPEDAPYPMPLLSSTTNDPIPALDPYTLLTRALEFESRTSALNASAIVLLLKPLVPPSVIDTYQATAILRQHHSRLSTMGLFVEATLLRNVCVRGWPDGLPSWGENYTSIFGPAQRDVKISLSCSNCHKPRELDPQDPKASVWTCERCKANMAPCAVCGHRDPEPATFNPIIGGDVEEEALSGWWYCPACAHGGHASCLQAWHSPDPSTSSAAELTAKFSSGCCPLDGCGHACLPGRYRSETATSREELSRAVSAANSGVSSPRHSGVRDAGDSVPQSRAVGMAREVLGKSSGAREGILSSSPGGRERRKSVKFAKTG